jgi:dolichyl-phosphate beta-glucosyltransferase
VRLSIVIPAFNEEERIGSTLRTIDVFLDQKEYDAEVIVVDDGSVDDTVAVTHEASPNARVISYRPNRGKGHAVRTGMTAAKGEVRLFCDADGSTPIEEVDKLWPLFDGGADVVIGSRSLPGSDVQIHQPWYRENMGRMFNRIIRVLGVTHFPDTQCGFKAFTAHACGIVLPRQTVERFSFDAELLYIAQKHELRVEQLPIRWINCPHTSVNPVSDSARMFWDAMSIRVKDAMGRYR